MNLVVDTSVIIAVIANEPEKAALIAKTQGATLFAPHSVYYEIGNAFSAMFKRGRITLEQATLSIQVYKQIPLTYSEIDLDQAIELSSRLNIYAYDSYIIACALNYGYPLLTLDSGLINAAKTAGVDVLEVSQTNADLS